MAVEKALDLKLARIHADPRGCKDFILADAKDAEMATGPEGQRPSGREWTVDPTCGMAA